MWRIRSSVVEALDSLEKAQIAFLNQTRNLRPLPTNLFGYTDHKAEVRSMSTLGIFITGFIAFARALLCRQQINLTYFLQYIRTESDHLHRSSAGVQLHHPHLSRRYILIRSTPSRSVVGVILRLRRLHARPFHVRRRGHGQSRMSLRGLSISPVRGFSTTCICTLKSLEEVVHLLRSQL